MHYASRVRRFVQLAAYVALGIVLSVSALLVTGPALASDSGGQSERMNCPSGFFYERLSGQCCVQDRSTLPENGKIGYTGNSLCEDGYVGEYEQRATTDGQGPPGCPNYTSFAFLLSCRVAGEEPVAPQPEPAGPEQPSTTDTEPAPASDDTAVSRVADSLTTGAVDVPSAGTLALAGVFGGVAGLLVGTTLLASPPPPAPSRTPTVAIDEDKLARLEHLRDQLENLRDELKDRLDTLRRQAEEGDLPSFESTLKELVGLVVTVAGGKGISVTLIEGEPIVWKVAEESLRQLPRNLFGGLSLSWSAQSTAGDMMDVDAFVDGLDLEAIAKNPDRLFERVSFEHGKLAGQIEDLNREIQQVRNPAPDPYADADPSTLTLEQAVAELDRVSGVRDELDAKIRTWDDMAPPGSKTGPSLRELHDLQDKLNTTLTKYSRWMNNLPADDAELEEFVESADWLGRVRSLATSAGTMATAAGLAGATPVGTALVSATAGGYTFGQAIKEYTQTSDLAERRVIMRTMVGNAQFLSGLVKYQIDAGHAAMDVAFTDNTQAEKRIGALKAHITALTK